MKKFVDKIKWTTRRDAADDMPVAKPRKRVNTSVFRDDVKAALEVLGRGGVILYPTDTVWGMFSEVKTRDGNYSASPVAFLFRVLYE